MLSRSLRTHLILAPSTNIGKSIFATALCRASVDLKEGLVGYLKPVGTGAEAENDEGHIQQYAPHVITKCLFHLDEPVSPHLAAQYAGNRVLPTDKEFMYSVATYIEEFGTRVEEMKNLPGKSSELARGVMYIESAGGVHSPTLAGNSQIDVFRDLLPPVILIASHQLGGISTTISAYESLLIRGYTVDAVLVFRESYYQNYDYFTDYFEKDRGIKLGVIDAPPKLASTATKETKQMNDYYNNLSALRPRAYKSQPSRVIHGVVDELQALHESRLADLDSMPKRAMEKVWWPFVQHGKVKKEEDVMVIDSAQGDFFKVYQEKENSKSLLHSMYDGSASWWTQCLGHGNIALSLAAAQAAGRYGHILFPTAISKPSLELTEKLLDSVGTNWADRVFFSDDGSTGMEVAIKMALRGFVKRNQVSESEGKDLMILGLKGSYHGDTIGAMDACEDGIFNKSVEWYRGKGFWLDSPEIRIENGKTLIRFTTGDGGCLGTSREKEYTSLAEIYDVETRLINDDLAEHYRIGLEKVFEEVYRKGEGKVRFGALILEPIVMGAGGMIFVDPLYQRVLIDLVRTNRALFPDLLESTSSNGSTPVWSGLPIVFDEVFAGLRRLGPLSTTSLLKTTPDIAVYAKILTGGLIPMAVTLASSSIFDAFLGEEKVEALLHGHSYTAHPIGCSVALEALKIMDGLEEGGTFVAAKKDWSSDKTSVVVSDTLSPIVWSLWSQEFVKSISSLSSVQSVMTLGTVLVIHLRSESTGYSSTAATSILDELKSGTPLEADSVLSTPLGLPFNIHARPLGNIIYFMSSLNSAPETIKLVEKNLERILSK